VLPSSIGTSKIPLNMVKQAPRGGVLIDLMLTTESEKEAAIQKATVHLQASDRQFCDVELIMNGGFSPLIGFIGEATYQCVVETMAPPDGTIFGLPVVFDSGRHDLQPGATILLSQGDLPIDTAEFADKYLPNKPVECKKCYGTSRKLNTPARSWRPPSAANPCAHFRARRRKKSGLVCRRTRTWWPSSAAIQSTGRITSSSPAPSTIRWFDTDRDDLQLGSDHLLSQSDLPIATVKLTDKYLSNEPVGCKSATARLGN
jgi:hypothetical protein